MPFVSTTGGLNFYYPTDGTTNWGTTLRETWNAISAHDHTGSGRGVKISANALAANAVTETSFRLSNNSYLRGRNFAGSADVDIIKVNADDTITLGETLASPEISEATFSGTTTGINVDGWEPAGEAWAYASATTITVPTDATTKYAVGDKIKLTQTTVKYFVVTGVTATVLTITGGTTYTLANAAITSPYFSHKASPVGFPAAFAYTPTLSCSGSMTYGSTSITFARFSVIGRLCRLYLEFTGTTGGTASTDIIATLPITQASAMTTMAYVVNGAGQPAEGFCLITGGNAVFRKKDGTATDFGLGAGRECRVSVVYEI